MISMIEINYSKLKSQDSATLLTLILPFHFADCLIEIMTQLFQMIEFIKLQIIAPIDLQYQPLLLLSPSQPSHSLQQSSQLLAFKQAW
jgi:hypothetical protein